MRKEKFEVITMITKNNKKLYFCSLDNGQFSWQFSNKKALCFETVEQAKAFAKRYFKNFHDWKIEEVTYTF